MQIQRGIILLLGLMVAGCTAKTISNVIYEDRANIVRLESIPEGSSQSPENIFQHPLELSEEELALILQSIRIQKKLGFITLFKREKPTSAQAFTMEEAQGMAGPLSQALHQVQSNQRVTFLFAQARGRIFKGVTSGVLFVKDDRLHLILGRYRSASRPHEKDITLTTPVLPSRVYTGFKLSAGPYQSIVDVDKSPIWKEPTGPQHWVMVDYRELLENPPEPEPFPVLTETMETQKPTESGQSPNDLDIKEKLRLLKQLHDEDLINEEEYDEKRQDLLKEF
jgi:hypothetical protein